MSVVANFTVRRTESFSVSVELNLESGSTTALVGPNGAGKSTVVSALAGLLPIDSGQIEIDGHVVDAPESNVFVPPNARHVGVVFQDYLLFDHLTVSENISFGPKASGASSRDALAVADALIARFELDAFADRHPNELSGGQAQRVALARAIAIDPALLLLDEPLAALDVGTRSRIRRTLRDQLDDFAGPRLLITHDPTDAFLLAENIIVLEHGRVVQAGPAEDVRRHPATPYVAALSGRNLLEATNDSGRLTVAGSTHRLQTSDTSSSGAVLVSIPPSAIALHPSEPHGSPRNTWETVVSAIEPLGDTSRVYLAEPLPLSADLTPGAVSSLSLEPGSPVWVSIKATEIDVTPV